MPANLTRPFIEARERYQAATDPKEQLDALQEMLREIPKHKGTDHLQADIKRKIKEVRAELTSEKHRKKGGPSYHVEKGRYQQVVVVGAPNAGKSALVRALTGVETDVAPYPYATREPHPTMMPFENARVQLVDMPPIAIEHMESWIPSIVRGADAVLLAIDLLAGDLLESTDATLARLAEQKLFLGPVPEEHRESIGAVGIRTLVAANKRDAPGAEDSFEIFRELYADRFEVVAVSAETGAGVEDLRQGIWRLLDVVRAIPKPPGKPPDDGDPIVLPRGSTVIDMAYAVHRELADHLQRARVWRSPDHADGQWVARDHVIADLEVIELGG